MALILVKKKYIRNEAKRNIYTGERMSKMSEEEKECRLRCRYNLRYLKLQLCAML